MDRCVFNKGALGGLFLSPGFDYCRVVAPRSGFSSWIFCLVRLIVSVPGALFQRPFLIRSSFGGIRPGLLRRIPGWPKCASVVCGRSFGRFRCWSVNCGRLLLVCISVHALAPMLPAVAFERLKKKTAFPSGNLSFVASVIVLGCKCDIHGDCVFIAPGQGFVPCVFLRWSSLLIHGPGCDLRQRCVFNG